jgi:hypothetical protein
MSQVVLQQANLTPIIQLAQKPIIDLSLEQGKYYACGIAYTSW